MRGALPPSSEAAESLVRRVLGVALPPCNVLAKPLLFVVVVTVATGPVVVDVGGEATSGLVLSERLDDISCTD